MTIIFISNFMNHHQLPLCLELYKCLGDGFKFIAFFDMPKTRIDLGYSEMNKRYPFIVCKSDVDEEEIRKMSISCDILIIGSAPDKYMEERLSVGKITIKYSERYFKNKGYCLEYINNLLCSLKHIRKYQNKPLYYLCASAYTATDVNKFANFRGRTYKWGYFPKVNLIENIEEVIKNKKTNSLIWVGRFIDWKHPEVAVNIVKRLVNEGYNPSLKMIGNGLLLDDIRKQIKDENLENYICAEGAVAVEEVHRYMKESQIFLFTSDQREGWGAVLNEAMGNACAVVANFATGSAPYLVDDGVNGYSYKEEEELYKKVKELLENSALRERLSKNAYKTISETWSAKTAAYRLIELCGSLMRNEACDLYDDGPCSRT